MKTRTLFLLILPALTLIVVMAYGQTNVFENLPLPSTGSAVLKADNASLKAQQAADNIKLIWLALGSLLLNTYHIVAREGGLGGMLKNLLGDWSWAKKATPALSPAIPPGNQPPAGTPQ